MIDCCMCCGSFIVRLREMVGVSALFSCLNASRRVWSILAWSRVYSAFSFAIRYMISLGLRLWSGAVEIGLNGIDVSFGVNDVWRLRARYGVWIQLGRMSSLLLRDVCLCS